jgi:hypothetical protein
LLLARQFIGILKVVGFPVLARPVDVMMWLFLGCLVQEIVQEIVLQMTAFQPVLIELRIWVTAAFQPVFDPYW